jgi:hypothetical protein
VRAVASSTARTTPLGLLKGTSTTSAALLVPRIRRANWMLKSFIKSAYSKAVSRGRSLLADTRSSSELRRASG